MTRRTRLSRRAQHGRIAVDLRAALGLCGALLRYLSLAFLFPAVVAVYYREPFWPFLVAAAATAVSGLALQRLGREASGVGVREGYLVVALTWLLAAVYGAIPFMLSGNPQLDRPVDAFFESMSGFSATGATILSNVETVDQSMLMWRQFTNWVGGMGIIVLALAVLPRLRVGGRQLFESELPGPEVGQLAERIRSTARRLWLLYVGMTVVMIVTLALLGFVGIDHRMGLFEAISIAFTTMSTGGFMPENRSLEGFAAASQWVTLVFMLVAGVNFALTYRAVVRRQPRRVLRDEELRIYLLLLTLASVALVTQLWLAGIERGEAAVRHGVFQVVSTMTTTGLASVDFAGWPILALTLLVFLIFIGGSAGSTSGGIKVIRHLLLAKFLHREVRQTLHPEEVLPIRLNGVPVEERTLRAVISFVLIYLGIFAIGVAVITVDSTIQGPPTSLHDAIATAAGMLSCLGTGLGLAGPMESFARYSDISTTTMAGMMWLGRLEVIPVVLLLSRNYWRV